MGGAETAVAVADHGLGETGGAGVRDGLIVIGSALAALALAATTLRGEERVTAPQIAVIGSGAEHEARAEEVGRLLAERGCTVVTGGRSEVMAAAARGARTAGGTAIAVLPGVERAEANEWSTHVVATGVGHARNLAVVASADAAIAVGGAWGTLSEIGLAGVLGRPVVILEPGWQVEGLPRAATPAEAVELALALATRAQQPPDVGST